jgi:hypothetical protein
VFHLFERTETPAAAADGAVAAAAAAAAAAAGTRKRKFVTRDASTELSSPAIRAQLENTAPIVVEMTLAPATKRAMRQYELEHMSALDLMRRPPLEGLCPELAAMYTRNVDAALSANARFIDYTADDEDEQPAATLEADALGANLADTNVDPFAGGGDFGGGPDDYNDFGAGPVDFGAYGEDEMPSTQQLLDDDFNVAPVGGADAAGGAGDDADAAAAAAAAAAESEEDELDAGEGGGDTDAQRQARSWSLHTQRMHAFLDLSFKSKAVSQLSFFEMTNGKFQMLRDLFMSTIFPSQARNEKPLPLHSLNCLV